MTFFYSFLLFITPFINLRNSFKANHFHLNALLNNFSFQDFMKQVTCIKNQFNDIHQNVPSPISFVLPQTHFSNYHFIPYSIKSFETFQQPHSNSIPNQLTLQIFNLLLLFVFALVMIAIKSVHELDKSN